jgi:hypothetical protein
MDPRACTADADKVMKIAPPVTALVTVHTPKGGASHFHITVREFKNRHHFK